LSSIALLIIIIIIIIIKIIIIIIGLNRFVQRRKVVTSEALVNL